MDEPESGVGTPFKGADRLLVEVVRGETTEVVALVRTTVLDGITSVTADGRRDVVGLTGGAKVEETDDPVVELQGAVTVTNTVTGVQPIPGQQSCSSRHFRDITGREDRQGRDTL